jgi:ketosteroid isomerase-like protein
MARRTGGACSAGVHRGRDAVLAEIAAQGEVWKSRRLNVPMEPELIARIRHSYELFNTTGDFDEAFFHPEVEWHNAPEFPEATVHHGVEAVRADLAAQGEAWESRRTDVLDVLTSENTAAVHVRISARGKASGVDTAIDVTHVWTLEDGRVRRIEVFVDRRAALKAAGLAGAAPGRRPGYSPSSDR